MYDRGEQTPCQRVLRANRGASELQPPGAVVVRIGDAAEGNVARGELGPAELLPHGPSQPVRLPTDVEMAAQLERPEVDDGDVVIERATDEGAHAFCVHENTGGALPEVGVWLAFDSARSAHGGVGANGMLACAALVAGEATLGSAYGAHPAATMRKGTATEAPQNE